MVCSLRALEPGRNAERATDVPHELNLNRYAAADFAALTANRRTYAVQFARSAGRKVSERNPS